MRRRSSPGVLFVITAIAVALGAGGLASGCGMGGSPGGGGLSCTGPGVSQCGGACVDLDEDRGNCGACGNACPAAVMCVGGVCGGPQVDMGVMPRDGGTDVGVDAFARDVGVDANTSDVGIDASNDAGIDAFVSDAGCAVRQCASMCVDSRTDNSNCGACGNVCMNGQTCSAGACACRFPTGTTCTGRCVDPTSDTNHCGACGTRCMGTTPVCSNGSCVAMCNTASGQTACGSQCVLLGSDRANCGTCGHACMPSETCSGGVCTPPATDPIGCADGTREHFATLATYPQIAACQGGWDGNGGMVGYTGIVPSPLRTTGAACSRAGNSGSNPNGTGCSAADLCSAGWHLCQGGEVGPRTGGAACGAETWPSRSFYAAGVGSTGCYNCALITGTVTTGCTNVNCRANCQANPGLTNDIFGCGDAFLVSAGACDVNMSGQDRCVALTRWGWSCGTDNVRESVNAVYNPSTSMRLCGGTTCVGADICCDMGGGRVSCVPDAGSCPAPLTIVPGIIPEGGVLCCRD